MMSRFFRSAAAKTKTGRKHPPFRLLLEALETRNLPAPLTPTGLVQTGETISSLTLSWNASTGPNGVAGYDVYLVTVRGHSGRGGGTTTVYTPVASGVTTTSATLSGLYSGSSAWYSVDAYDSTGAHSGKSAIYTGKTLPDTVPPVLNNVPGDQTVTTNTPSGTPVSGAFTATGSDPGSGIDKVTVTYSVNGYPIDSSYPFPLNNTTVTVTASDLYGQHASATFTITVLNAKGPTLTVVPANQIAEATSAAGAQVPAAFTAAAVDLTASNPTITYTVGTTPIVSSYTFPFGVTTVNVTATDTNGASASGMFTVTVRDTTPPTLTVPGNVTVEATSPAGARAPAAFTATATDLVTAHPTITYITYVFGMQTIDSSFVFPIGTTYVTIEATDAAGNTSTGSLYVTVQDTTPPTLTLPPNQVVSPMGPAGAVDPAAFTATATDIASAYPPIIAYAVGGAAITPTYTFPLGVTTVQVKATDSSGNVSSGTFTVTVPPPPGLSLFIPADQTLQAASASGALDPAAFTTTTFDPGNTPTVIYTAGGNPIDSSTVFPVGTTTVTVTASDSAGNNKSGTFTVTVQAPPVLPPPSPLAWKAGVNLPVGIADAAANTLDTGVWLFGGASATGNGSSVYYLAPSSTTWVAGPSLDRGYVSAAVGETHNPGPRYMADEGGFIYKYASDFFLYGGADAGSASNGVTNYDVYPGANQGKTVTAPSMSTARSALAYATDPATGDLYALGGLDQAGVALASAEVYDPNADSWSAIAPLPQALNNAAAFADGAGHLFVVGGDNSAGAPVAATYRYTIATNTWDTAASLPVATSQAAGVVAPDGTFYLLGGKTAAGAVSSVLVYNPAANFWSATTPLPAPVYGAAAAIDSSGNIEVIGGYDNAGHLQTTVQVGQNLPPALPTHVAIVEAPGASVGTNQVVTVTVAVENAAGNVVTSQSGTSMTVTIAGPDGITPVGIAAVPVIGGTASYSFTSGTFPATSPGMYTVAFSDDPLPGASVTFGIGVSQAVPTVTVSGGSFTYDGTLHFASATAAGAGGAAVNGSFSFTYNSSPVMPTDAGTYSVVATFTSSDSSYSSTMATGTLTITQASPIVTLGGGTVAYDGSAHAVTAKALGVDGVTPVSGTFAITYNGSPTAPTAPGTYTVVAVFTSSDPNNDYTNLTAMDSLTIVPAKLVVSAPASATAGMPFNLTVTAQDGAGNAIPGFSGLVTLSSSSGSDLSPASILVLGGTATIPVTLTAAGSQIITPAFPGLPATTATVVVTAGPFSQYQVTVQGASTIQAGNSFLVAVQATDAAGNPVSSYSGPSTVTASISPTSTASNFPITVPIGSSGLGFFLADLQKVGTYTITAANSSYSGSAPVTVTAGPAVKLGFGAQPVSTPTGVSLPAVTVQVLDAFGNVVASDNSDAVSLRVVSGPGSFTPGSTTTATVYNGLATFSNLTLVNPGSYTLGVVVPSQFTGPDSAAFSLAPLQVVPSSFAGTPSGFSLQLNAPFLVNSVTPVLYGQGFGASAPLPTVTLTQTLDAGGTPVSNPVAGSLVLNTATNTLTFLATNTAYEASNGSPLLPDGTYTAVIHSTGTGGLQAKSGGGFLDGRGTGTPGSGDFTTTFVVNAGATHLDVVWVPAVAVGPGQTLNAPGMNQAGGGYPIYVSDNTGTVTSVNVTLNYDPALLTVSGVTGAGFALLGSSTPGHAVLQYSGPALSAGSQTPIGFLTASVPSGTASNPTPYRAKDLLHLSGVSLNEGAIPVATSDGLHVVAYVGDADGNGSYSSNDAVLITRVALQTDTGFAAYPLVDPVIVADTDGAGFIPADAALQVNEAGVGFPTANLSVPPIPSGVVFQPIANNVDPTVSIPETLYVAADGTLTVPVYIDDAHPEGSTGLLEAHLALAYDPRLFTLTPADVHAGSVLVGGDWSVVPTIDQAAGEIGIALSSNTPIRSAVGGSLVTINFHPYEAVRGQGAGVRDEWSALTPDPSPLTPILLVASASPNGQYVATELEDAQGSFILTPAPINGFEPRIDSVVLLTTSPAAGSVSSAPVIVTTSQVVGTSDDSHPAQTHALDTVSPPASAVGPESHEPEFVAGPPAPADPATMHIGPSSAHGAATMIAATSSLAPAGTLAAAPVTGLGIAFANPTVVNLQGPAGVASWQHLAEQLFQALVHVPGPNDPTLVGFSRESLERALAGKLLLSPSASDNFDALNWEEGGDEQEGQGVAGWSALSGSHGRREAASRLTPPPIVAPVAVERAALDQVFAQAADDTETGTPDY